MRSPLRKELIACFTHEMQQRFPQFTLYDKDSETWTWRWTIAPVLTFFVSVQSFRGKDQFVVEVSWSEDGVFPWGAMGKTETDRPQGRQRLGQLWRKGSPDPVWDIDPEHSARVRDYLRSLSSDHVGEYPPDPSIDQSRPRICPLVRDAVDKFERYGMPLFRQVAEARKLPWPE